MAQAGQSRAFHSGLDDPWVGLGILDEETVKKGVDKVGILRASYGHAFDDGSGAEAPKDWSGAFSDTISESNRGGWKQSPRCLFACGYAVGGELRRPLCLPQEHETPQTVPRSFCTFPAPIGDRRLRQPQKDARVRGRTSACAGAPTSAKTPTATLLTAIRFTGPDACPDTDVLLARKELQDDRTLAHCRPSHQNLPRQFATSQISPPLAIRGGLPLQGAVCL